VTFIVNANYARSASYAIYRFLRLSVRLVCKCRPMSHVHQLMSFPIEYANVS